MGVFRRVLKVTCQGSSMKALPRIIRAPTTFQRLLWIVALLVGLGAAGYQLMMLLLDYLQYSTSVNIVEVTGSPPFPDVTICHLDPTWTFRKLKSEIGEEISFSHYIQKLEHLQKQYEPDSIEYQTLEAIKNFPGYLQNVHRIHTEAEMLKDLFIIDCYVALNWDPKPCFIGHKGITNTVFLDPYFGLCVTFHITDVTVKGLNVVLYLDDPEVVEPQQFNFSDDYKTHTSTVGARVVIHPQDSFPDIWLASHHVHAGMDVGFDIQGTKRTVLDEPYGNCTSATEAKIAQEAGVPGNAINRHGYECYRMCAKDHVQVGCGCLHVHYTSTSEDRANRSLCGHLIENNISATVERYACAESVVTELEKDFQNICPCVIPCEQFMYDYSTKAIEWPHDTYHLSFYEQYIRNSSFATKFKVYEGLLELSRTNTTEAQRRVSQETLIKRNFAQIRVLNHQRTYLHYSETPLISPEALFGNVGGLLNLWVGITFITFMEIIDFIHQLLTQRKAGKDGAFEDKRSYNGSAHNHPETTHELLKQSS